MATRWGQAYYNHAKNATLFRIIKESTFVVYIAHYFWIEVYARYLVYENDWTFIPGYIVTFVLTAISSMLTYVVIKQIPIVRRVFGIKLQPKKTN